jgi:hypothetical protein
MDMLLLNLPHQLPLITVHLRTDHRINTALDSPLPIHPLSLKKTGMPVTSPKGVLVKP